MFDPSLASAGLKLLEHLPVGLVLYRLEQREDDDSLTVVGFNEAAEEILGRHLQGLIGKRISDAFPAVTTERIALYAEVARAEVRRVMGEATYGDPKVTTATYLVTAAGIGQGLVGVIFENLTAERLSTTFLDAIIESVPNMIFVKEAKELRFERFNRAGEELLGVDRSQLIGKNDFDLFPKDQAQFFQARDREALASNRVVDIPEEPIQTKSGERWLHTRKVPIRDASGAPTHLLGISEDITEQKEREEQLKHLIDQLEESNAELDSFTYSVSHDLRAPLRAIDGFSRMLLADHGAVIGEEGRRMAGVITRNAVRMGQLIDDLLAFSRLGRKQVDKRPTDMTQLAQAAYDEVRDGSRDVQFELAELPVVNGDPALLKQVWVNLLSNAVKYTRGREPALIQVTAVREGDEHVFRVKDNGVGFDPRFRAKLFGVFERLHSPADYEGTGVGLALVQRIVKRHGGWVRAESVLGQGATFMFGVPAA